MVSGNIPLLPPAGRVHRRWAQVSLRHDMHYYRSLVAALRGERIPPPGLLRGVETEPVRQPLSVLGVRRHARMTPEVPPDLRRYLEDDELARPGGESALCTVRPLFRHHRQHLRHLQP